MTRESFSNTTDDKFHSFAKSPLHPRPMQTSKSSSSNQVRIYFPLMRAHGSPILFAFPNPLSHASADKSTHFSISRELEPLLGRSCRQANTDEGRGWPATAHRPSLAHHRFLDGARAKNVFYTLRWLKRSMTHEVT